jgi:hypothetical protein
VLRRLHRPNTNDDHGLQWIRLVVLGARNFSESSEPSIGHRRFDGNDLGYDSALTTGNLIEVTQANNGATSSAFWSYLSNGNVQSQTDAKGISTVICYDSTYNLYPIKRVVGATNTSCPSPATSSVSQTTIFSFDFASGVLSSQTDQDNDVLTSYSYDSLSRTTGVTQAQN